MKKIIVIQLLLVVILFSCKKEDEDNLCQDFELEQPSLIDDVEYEIINAFLEANFIDADFVHIDQETKSPVHIQFIEDKLTSENIHLDTLLLPDYVEKNQHAYFFSVDNFSLNTAQLINPLEIDCIFSVELKGWENYYTKYPKSTGIYTFYRPGINAAGNQAIVEYGWQAAYDTGMGYLLVLEKESNKWIVKHRLYTWAS